MRYVLDSCVAIKWELREADSDRAIRLRDDGRQGYHSFLAPDVFPAEVAHAITRAERKGRITPAEGASSLVELIAERPLIFPSLPLIHRAYSLSSAYRIGVYDCVYVALAEREGCELVTADDKLLKNLGPHFPLIRPLASFP